MKTLMIAFLTGYLFGQSFTWIFGEEKAEKFGLRAGTWCRVNILGLEPINGDTK